MVKIRQQNIFNGEKKWRKKAKQHEWMKAMDSIEEYEARHQPRENM